MKEDLKKKRFYKIYGKHVLLIEITLILTLDFALTLILFFPSIVTVGAWGIAFFAGILIHRRILNRIVNSELFEYEILYLDHFRSYVFSITIIFSVFLSILWVYFPLDSFSTEILRAVRTMTVASLLITFFLKMRSITNHQKARLSFKIVLNAMELLRKEMSMNEKTKLIGKYLNWFKSGLRSYNSYLYKNNPINIQIVDIGEHHRSVCNVALMGKSAEVDNTIEQIESALNSLGRREREDDLRQFLIALKNEKSGKTEKDYPKSELNEMTRIWSTWERIIENLKSPYVALLIAIITITLRVWPELLGDLFVVWQELTKLL